MTTGGDTAPADRSVAAARAVTADEVRAAERPLLEAGVPLMARAASALAVELRRERPSAVLLLAGSGDNGGDGLFAVAELARDGVPVRIVPTGSRLHEGGLAAATTAGAVIDRTAPAELPATLREGETIVDAMVGIGSDGAGLRGAAHDVAAALLPALGTRAGRHRVVAVDVPSGIGVDDGSVPDDGILLPADVTVTFGAIKRGTTIPPAAALCGRIVLVDLGLRFDQAPD